MNRAEIIIQSIMAGDFSTAMSEAKSEIKSQIDRIVEDHQSVLLSSYGMKIIEQTDDDDDKKPDDTNTSDDDGKKLGDEDSEENKGE